MERDKQKQLEKEREKQENETQSEKIKLSEKDALEIIKSTVRERKYVSVICDYCKKYYLLCSSIFRKVKMIVMVKMLIQMIVKYVAKLQNLHLSPRKNWYVTTLHYLSYCV